MQTSAPPARSRASIVLSQVGVSRGGHPLIADLDLTVSPTSRLAIVGENGRGKSTLVRVLDGRLRPESGSITRTGTIGVADQDLSTADARTIGEIVAAAIADSLAALAELDAASQALADGDADAGDRYAAALERAEALDAWDAARRVDIALAALGAESDRTRRLSSLSVGQRYRVRLACLLGGDTDILLLDEPTNHLDRSGLQFLTDNLRGWRGGVVVVSHDRALLRDIAVTVLDLDPTPDGRPRLYGGGYEGYRSGRMAQIARWEQEHSAQEAEQQRLADDLSAAQNRLVSGWRPDKGTGKHQRATRASGVVQAVHRRRAALEEHRVTTPQPPRPLAFPELRSRSGAPLIEVADVTVHGRLATAVSLRVAGGSRTVITGPNGAGKSTLLAVLAGELAPTTGRAHRAQRARIAYLRQESDLPVDRRAAALYEEWVGQLIGRRGLSTAEVPGLSSLGLLTSREASRRVGELSVGQRRRLDLAMSLAARPQVLLLDEPTNHLSITLVDELTEALHATHAAVVLSSHDRQLLADTADWPRIVLEFLTTQHNEGVRS